MPHWFSKRVNIVFTVWLLFTVLILVNHSLFYINDYISVPQHGHVAEPDFGTVSQFIIDSGKQASYNWYFLLDAIWAFFLVVLVGLIIRDTRRDQVFKHKKAQISVYNVYTFFASFAYLFDIIEGFSYVFFISSIIELFVKLKIIFYALAMLCLVYWSLRKYIIPNIRDILRFIGTSSLSLFFIGIIYLLMTLMPQGGTLVVELFYVSGNIIVFFALLTFLTILVSHFPVYVDIWRHADNDIMELKMPERNYRFLGLDLIYYIPNYGNEKKMAQYERPLVVKMRRSLGILLYVAIFNIVMGVLFRFYEINASAAFISLVIIILTLKIYDVYGRIYIKWNNDLYSKDPSREDAAIKQIIAYVRWFPFYFVVCTLMVLVTFFIALDGQWSRIAALFFLLTLGLQMFLYVYFKICRGFFRYVFYSPKLKNKKRQLVNEYILEAFQRKRKSKKSNNNLFIRSVSFLSDNVRYLSLMRFAGMLSLLTLILANLWYDFASWLNPLNIIMLYIILFYSIIIITFKHILYYHRVSSAKKVRFRMTYKYGLPSILIILFVVLTYLAGLQNDLHKLKLVDMNEPLLDYQEYFTEMTHEAQGESKNYFFVGSYGGGLKANLWNLLLFDVLQKESDQQFLKRTLVLSGVSGGAVGIGNYSALMLNSKDSTERAKRINVIGKSNVLSNEITYLLGADWAREYVPMALYKHCGKDRSYMSMKEHARFTGMEPNEYNKFGFSDYWNQIYEDQDCKFPMLVMNTTAVGGRQGVATSIKLPNDAIPGARVINLYEFDDTGDTISCSKEEPYVTNSRSTITYFGAVSTTNRFPFFSPTAKIHGKGSYLDGGYFENSGMLTAYEIYDVVAGDPSKDFYQKINPVFINIINSEDYYILKKVADWGIKPVNANDTGEISAIIGTLASIDKLTGYMHRKMEAKDFVVEQIMMPHKISYKKVKGLLNAEVDDPLCLIDSINVHNRLIDQALRDSGPYLKEEWGVIEPPLARLLGEPAVEYQKAMVNYHPDVKNAIQRIVSGYLAAKENVTKQDQEIYTQQQRIDPELFKRSVKGKFGVDPQSSKVPDSLKVKGQ